MKTIKLLIEITVQVERGDDTTGPAPTRRDAIQAAHATPWFDEEPFVMGEHGGYEGIVTEWRIKEAR